MDTTLDGLLNQRIKLEQPAAGYRVAVDTVLLAAASPVQPGQRVLDLGCGVGGAMLCLAARVPGLTITGIEIQSELAALCEKNIARNHLAATLNIRAGDLTLHLDDLADKFDQVIMNPPYHGELQHDVSVDAQKRVANTETDGDLELWIAAAARALKTDGILSLIHRADRLREILLYLPPKFGGMEVLPVLPKADADRPKRILIRAKKGAQDAITYCSPLVLHDPSGGYTEAAEDILRHLKAAHFVQ